jgi:L-cysteine/cystine lyase
MSHGQAAKFPVFERLKHFNTGSNGPLPLIFTETLARLSQDQLHNGTLVPHTMQSELAALRRLRSVLAGILGGESSRLILCASTSSALALALEALAPKRGGVALVEEFEHPAVKNSLTAKAGQKGFEVREVAAPVHVQDRTEIWLTELAKLNREQDALMITSPVSWINGSGLDLKRVIGAAQKLRVRVLLDGAQSAGAVPVHFDDLGADAFCFPSQKWLFGPNGFGGLLLSQSAAERAQESCTARSYLPLEALDWPLHQLEVQGLTWFFPALEAWCRSLEWIESQCSWAKVYERTAQARKHLLARVAESSVLNKLCSWPQSTEDRGGGLVHFSLETSQAQTLAQEMLQDRWYVRSIPEPAGLRVSVAFFHETSQIDELVVELETRLKRF